MPSEIGAEYTLSELQSLPEKTVVVLQAYHPHIAVTMWLAEATFDCLTFYAGELNITLLLFPGPDGVLVDGQDNPIRVFRYLGKV